MARARPVVNGFGSGEVTPRLYGRFDLDWYRHACREIINFVVLPHGPAVYRPGTRFKEEAKDSTRRTRVIAFRFSTEQAYIVEFGHLYMRFYKDGARIESPPGTPIQIATPWTETQIFDVHFAQSADVMWLVHEAVTVRELTRTSHIDWIASETEFEDGPYIAENLDLALTITASAVTGAGITLTAASALFEADHVGALWRLSEATGTLSHDGWETGAIYAAAAVVKSFGGVYKTAGGGTAGKRPPVHRRPGQIVTDGAVAWEFLHAGSGWVKITGFTSNLIVTADVKSRLPDSVLAGTSYWNEGAWSTKRGFPRAVNFFEERLSFAGTPDRPQTLWGSTSAGFTTMSPGVDAADAINNTLASGQVNAIRWLLGTAGLVVGTVGGEWIMRASRLDEGLTPTNVSARQQNDHESSKLRPLFVGDAILFVEDDGRVVRELVYDGGADRLVARDVTRRADHIPVDGIVDWCYQKKPWSVVWAATAAGELLAFTYVREELVQAWTHCPLGGGGKVESLAAIPGPDGYEVWMVVNRVINAVTKRYIERLDPFFGDKTAQEDAFFVDSGLTYDGVPVSEVLGADHLEGQSVMLLADGAVEGPKTVIGGKAPLDNQASKVQLGLGYTGIVEPIRPPALALGQIKRVPHVILRLFRSLGTRIEGNTGLLHEALRRAAELQPGTPPALFSGDIRVPVPDAHGRDGFIRIEQSDPLPCMLTSLAVPAHVGDD